MANDKGPVAHYQDLTEVVEALTSTIASQGLLLKYTIAVLRDKGLLVPNAKSLYEEFGKTDKEAVMDLLDVRVRLDERILDLLDPDK